MIRRTLMLAVAGLIVAAKAAPAEPLEVLHFWKAPSERAALDVFAEAYEAAGGTWNDIATENEYAHKTYVIDRISSGFAPSAVQWHGGPEIRELLDLGIIAPVDAVTEGGTAPETLLPQVREALTTERGLGALPVGIHSDNWAWRNLQIYRALGLEAPRDWAHFLEQAKVIRAAGFQPLAVGGFGWERTVLLTSMMLDVGGAGYYRRFLAGALSGPEDRATLVAVFDLLLGAREVSTSAEAEPETWSDATRMVIEGRAAMQVMGDWAKGEFLSVGRRPGIDFECSMAPGNDEVMSIVLDVFILPEQESPGVRAAQRQLVDIVLDPQNQRDFAMKKGSLPVVAGVGDEGFDGCMRLSRAVLDRPGSVVPALTLGLDQDVIALITGTVQQVWEDRTISGEQAADLFLGRLAIR